MVIQIIKGDIPNKMPEEILTKMDAFHNKEVLNTFFKNNWYSFYKKENINYFFHTFNPEVFYLKKMELKFGEVNPFLGYYGPIVSGSREFIKDALLEYINAIKKLGVIAEVIRFNPLLGNHKFFDGQKKVKLINSKKIVAIKISNDKTNQISEYSKDCKSMLKKGYEKCIFKKINKQNDWQPFVNFLLNSLKNKNAEKKFFMSNTFFNSAKSCEYFEGYGAYFKDKMVSAALILKGNKNNYYLMAGNTLEKIPGANEFLIHEISLICKKEKKEYLILGGGMTTNSNDSLLRFKKKFSIHLYDFYIGCIIHNEEIFKKVIDFSERIDKSLLNTKYFLKYHLLSK